MKIERWFFNLAAAALLLTAAAKVISSAGHGKILLSLDPVTGLQFRDLLRIVGGIEAAVALVCIFNRKSWLRAGLVAWLATNFLIYRIALRILGYHKPCTCLGNLTDGLNISPEITDIAMKLVLVYLLIGSYTILVLLLKWKRKSDYSSPAADAATGAI